MSKKEEVEISAEQFLKHARYYLHAAEVLTERLSMATAGPIGLLAAHSLELGLKAFLLHIGWNEDDLRKRVGHNLVDAWNASLESGLRLPQEPSFTVSLLALSHGPPYLFRYPREGEAAAITPPHELCRDVQMVLDAVETAIGLPALTTKP